MENSTYLTFTPTVSLDESGLPKRFSGIAYSGGLIPGYGGYGDSAIELASLTLPTGAIFALVDHDPAKRAGKLTAELRDNQIHVAGEFFAASEAGREVAALFKEGAPWQMSVGIQASSQSSAEKRDRQCNGQALSLHTLFTGATLREVSFVPVGADPSTSAVAFARSLVTHPGTPLMTTETLAAKKPSADCPKCGHNFPLPDTAMQKAAADLLTLSAQLDTQKTRADQAVAQLAQIKLATRQNDLKSLANDLCRELTAPEITLFSGLDDNAYQTLSATLRSFKPIIPLALTQEQAKQGKPPEGQRSMAEMNAAIFQQVAKG